MKAPDHMRRETELLEMAIPECRHPHRLERLPEPIPRLVLADRHQDLHRVEMGHSNLMLAMGACTLNQLLPLLQRHMLRLLLQCQVSRGEHPDPFPYGTRRMHFLLSEGSRSQRK